MPVSRKILKSYKFFMAGAALSVCQAASAQIAPPQTVETAEFATDAFSTGTLEPSEGALAQSLWAGTKPRAIASLLESAPTRPATPAIGEAMRRTLLSPGRGPAGAPASLGGQKLQALVSAGFVEEAATISSLSSDARGNASVAEAQAMIDLVNGDLNAACSRGQRLSVDQQNPFWVKLRVVCYANAGERDAADLTLGILREQYGLSAQDDIFLTAAAAGALPKTPPQPETVLHYSVAKLLDLPVSPGLLAQADGAVLVAVARDQNADLNSRIHAAEQAVAMGVLAPDRLAGLYGEAEFDVATLGAAAAAAEAEPRSAMSDALLFQSISEMNAPEFIRDKAKRIALALSIADGFARKYALSRVYAEEIAALEGVLLSPREAAQFAAARMVAGDSVGAANWLSEMVGPNSSVGALPEPEAMMFIELVNLLALLDPQSAAQLARSADVSLLDGNGFGRPSQGAVDVEPPSAEILRAAFEAVAENRLGQAGLVALAASRTKGGSSPGPANAVVVAQSLRAAGMMDLLRQYEFERAFYDYAGGSTAAFVSSGGNNGSENSGLAPRVKPRNQQ